MAIIISKNSKNAERVEESSFGLEDNLQQYISDNPDAIPIYEIDENIRLLVLAREFPTDSGPIDALGIDQNGEIYLVETKLYKNPDKRLVVAQVLDYGASLWKSSIDFDDFLVLLNKHVTSLFGIGATEKIGDFFDIEPEEVGSILENVKNNLNNGIFKFVVLMDKLERRLKDLILFLNQNSQFDVFAVELEYYKKDDLEIIIPKIHGAEVKKNVGVKQSGSSGRRTWTEAEFWKVFKEQTPGSDLNNVEKLATWLFDSSDEMRFGTGIKYGSINPRFKSICDRSFVTLSTQGKLQLSFGYLDNDDQREQFYKVIRKHIPSIDLESLTSGKPLRNNYPNLTSEQVSENYLKIQKAILEFTNN